MICKTSFVQSFLKSGIPYTEEQCTRYMFILTIMIKTSLVNQDILLWFYCNSRWSMLLANGTFSIVFGGLQSRSILPNSPIPTHTHNDDQTKLEQFCHSFWFCLHLGKHRRILIDLYKSVICCNNAPNSLLTCTMHPLKDKC